MIRVGRSGVICIAFVLACLLPICLANEAESWAAQYKKLGKFVVQENKALVRGSEDNVHNRDLLNLDNVRFCAIPEDQEVIFAPDTRYPTCNAEEYALALATIALPGILLAGLSLLGCILYTFCLCCSCCKCCCCGCAKKAAKPINKCKNLVIIILTAVAVAIVAVGFAFVITGNQATSTGTIELIDTVDTALQTVVDRISTIADRVQNLTGIPDDINYFIDEAQKTAKIYQDDSKGTIDMIRQLDSIRLAVIFIASLAAVIIVGLGFLACFCKKGRKFLMTMSVLAFVSSLVIWVSLAVHLVIVEIMHDMCDEIDRMERNDASSNGTNIDSPLGYLIKCRNNDTSLTDLFAVVSEGKEYVVNQTCSLIAQSCNSPGITCTGDYNNCNAGNVFSTPDTVSITDRTFRCLVGGTSQVVDSPTQCSVPASAVLETNQDRTIRECATSCDNTQLRSSTSQAVDSLAIIQTYFDLLDEIEQALNCRFVYDAFQGARSTICVTFIDSFTYIALGDALMGGGTAAAIVLFTVKFLTM